VVVQQKSTMVWLLLLCLCAFTSAERKTYEGYQLFHITPRNAQDIAYLHDLSINSIEYDFWKEPRGIGDQVDVFAPADAAKKFIFILTARKMQFVLSETNVARQIEEQFRLFDSRPDNHVFDIDQFNTLADIDGWVDALPGSCQTGVTCETYTIGTSIESRPIKAFRISKSGTGRKTYLIDGTTHCREWLSTATNLKVMDYLVNQYGVDADVTRLVDTYDWVIIPVVNPDGYEYTWTTERLWRKNRRFHGGAMACYGVDINRNFDFRWGTDGVSHNECQDTYCGPNGNSEPETLAVVNEYARWATTTRALVTMHSYGYMWMWPWGNYEVDQPGQVCDLSDDHQDLLAVGEPTADAVEATYGTTDWLRGNSCEVIYAATGATDDYTKGALNVKYAFTTELRGNGFIIAESEIDPSFREIWNGIVAMDNAITATEGPDFP